MERQLISAIPYHPYLTNDHLRMRHNSGERIANLACGLRPPLIGRC